MRSLSRSFGLVVVLTGACTRAAAPQAPALANQPTPPAVAPRPADDALLAWPVAPFTASQLAEAKGCDVEKLAGQRYPKTVALDALPAAFAVHGACDQATLAAACAMRAGHADPPAACLDTYRAAVRANPAFAFVATLPQGYFGKVALVAAPPLAAHHVEGVVLTYKWRGLGHSVDWTLTIDHATSGPRVAFDGPGAKHAKRPADAGKHLAAFGSALRSFLPIPGPLQAVDCTDNYPDWTAKLTFDDGETLELSTHGSNLLGLGGPWQMTVGGVTYLQLAPDFVRAVADLVEASALPIGEPEGEFCRGFDLAGAVLK